MRSGFFYDFSNYGSYERLTDDGLTQWHPAFLQLGNTLSDCAKKYKGFCHRYKSQTKPPRKCHWGSKILRGQPKSNSTTSPTRSKLSRTSRCQVTDNQK